MLSMLHKLPSSSQLHRENPLSAAETDASNNKIRNPDGNALNIASKAQNSSIHLSPKIETLKPQRLTDNGVALGLNYNNNTRISNSHFLKREKQEVANTSDSIHIQVQILAFQPMQRGQTVRNPISHHPLIQSIPASVHLNPTQQTETEMNESMNPRICVVPQSK